MKLFACYMKEHRLFLTIHILCQLLLVFMFMLCKIPADTFLYPILLVDSIFVIYALSRFFQYRSRYEKIHRITQPQFADSSRYPELFTQIEKEEYRLIQDLRPPLSDEKNTYERKQREMMDYYTVWVHQIKTPISAMKLHLQNEDSAFSRSLQADLFHIEQYVEMALAYLRLSSEETDYRFQKYDMDTLIRNSIRKFADEFIERKISMSFTPTGIQAVTDEKWFRFVMEQVISNALKYTPSGSVRIYASDRDTICFEDTGIGILPEDLPRIFDNGFTGYNGRLSPQASGLGLYLCRKICNNMNHSISASSIVGKGTRISIHLHQYQNLTQS